MKKIIATFATCLLAAQISAAEVAEHGIPAANNDVAPTGIDAQNYLSDASSKDDNAEEIHRPDFTTAAEALIQNMLSDPAFTHIPAGQRKVVAMGRLINDTAQRINNEILTAKISTALRDSGKFILTVAVTADSALDSTREDLHEQRDNANAKQDTLIPPDYILSGSITQKSVQLDNGKARNKYVFLLRLVDLHSGIVFWDSTQTID